MKNRIAGRKWSFQVFQHNQNKRFITLGQNKQKKNGWWELVSSPHLWTTHRNLDKLILSFPTPRSFAMLPNLRSEGVLPEGPHQLQVEENLAGRQGWSWNNWWINQWKKWMFWWWHHGTCFMATKSRTSWSFSNRTNTNSLIHFPELRRLCLFHIPTSWIRQKM